MTGYGFAQGQFVLARPGKQLSGEVVPALGPLYYSFIGFDAPSTAAEYSRFPQRDLARGILWSLAIVSVLYLAFTMSGGGFLPQQDEWATGWIAGLEEWVARLGLPADVLVLLYGQGRILRAVTRDGVFGKRCEPKPGKHKRKQWRLRWESIWACVASIGLSVLLLVGLKVDTGDLLAKFVSAATSVAFAIVAVGTMVLRVRRPDLPRTFTAPLLPVAAAIAVLASCGLILGTLLEKGPPIFSLPIFAGWTGVGAAIYLIVLVARIAAGRKE